MNYYLINIAYDGTSFAGFQWQKDAPTIQSEINFTLSKLFKCKFTTMGTSRTDSGVHAFEQIVKITIEDKINCETFVKNFNEIVNKSILCMDIFETDFLYRPTTQVELKQYRYFFTNIKNIGNLNTRFIANIANPLDIEKINLCLGELIGPHDFKNFTSTGSNVKSTEREISKLELSEVNVIEVLPKNSLFYLDDQATKCFQLKIEASGFLKQMNRHIVSALWSVGSGKLSFDEFKNILNGPKTTRQNWKVAPANGLFLYKINLCNL